ncbi:GIN domain-containing protein [Bacteroides rodentium]
MKTDIIGVIIALILTFVSVLSVCAQDAKVSEVRKVEVFSSIEITSVGTVYFTQSDTYSFRIEGKEKYVKNTETTVKVGCLRIGGKDRKNKSLRHQQDGVTIWISAPDLKEVEFTGVGQFNCEKPLKLDEVSFEVKGVGEVNVSDLTCNELKVALRGVGSADIHVTCDYLTAKMSCVGVVTLSGSAGHAVISKGGIGVVNTDNLKIGR